MDKFRFPHRSILAALGVSALLVGCAPTMPDEARHWWPGMRGDAADTPTPARIADGDLWLPKTPAEAGEVLVETTSDGTIAARVYVALEDGPPSRVALAVGLDHAGVGTGVVRPAEAPQARLQPGF